MLQLFNTLSKQKEVFKPLDASNVGMYVCGPTVYDFAHLGNARPVVVFDMLLRVLQKQYSKVTYVRNITDVDDKINAAAHANGEDIRELTTRTAKAYYEDMSALNALPPTYEPRATDHIDEMISIIESLINGGYAYANEGHVLFRVQKYKDYGHLSRRNQDELLAGARVEISPYKENAGDFVLWKPSTSELPGWESPWGRGRPGWHIECSAMSKAFLGNTFDIHGGGIDLVFPHHENEIAQSCCAHGTDRMAMVWMHNGHLLVNSEKMSKSLGNFFTVRDVLKNYQGEVIRFAFLSTHYRQPLDWTDESPKNAKATLDRFYKAIEYANGEGEISSYVIAALKDDLNTPLAISYLHELANAVFKSTGDEQTMTANTLKASGQFLGLLVQDSQIWFQGQSDNQDIDKLVNARHEAKQAKNFAEADRIRALLINQGITLEDGPNGTIWRRT
jgi:cysteinyl-tRNA synthetase